MKKRLLFLTVATFLLMMGTMTACAAVGSEILVPEITGLKQFEVPDTEAMAFLRQMKAGWDLGNTFDATADWLPGQQHGAGLETAWGNPATRPELFQVLREAGFGAVRIPVSWHNHVDARDRIDEGWMKRVREVAGYALEQGMTVIVNVHHDNMEGYFIPDEAHMERSEQYLSAVWKQMAEAFADCDEHLILESMNEPRLVGTNYEWYWDENAALCQEAARCINRLNQLFVDTVRATGGNNAKRYLSVPAYDASPYYAAHEAFQLPEDSAENRLIVAAHGYIPYNFALNLNSSDKTFDLRKDTGKMAEIEDFLTGLYDRFISKGIPVMMDEFGALDKGGELQDRVNFTAYYVAAASARGIPCFWWDNGLLNGKPTDEKFRLINRTTFAWDYPEIPMAMMKNLRKE